MARSTIWIAKEEDDQALSSLISSLKKAMDLKISVIDEDEEFEYLLNEFQEKNKIYVGKLLKYKRSKAMETVDPTKNTLGEENLRNYPLIEYSLFAVDENGILVEEKIPNMGHKRVLSKLLEIYKKVGSTSKLEYNFEFLFSPKSAEEFLKGVDKIKLVRFSDIRTNPDPEDEDLLLFEDLTGDTKSASIEIANSKGLNKKSRYIQGGFLLVEEGKAHMKLEGSKGDEPAVYNTRKGSAKEKETVEYHKEDRHTTVEKKFSEMIKKFLEK